MPMRYLLVSERNEDHLSDEVTRLLAEGWILYGSPTVSSYVDIDGQTHIVYAQAMTKR